MAPALSIAVDDRYVYYTDLRPSVCVVGSAPPGGACAEQSTVWSVPRCGGVSQDFGLPFSGGPRIVTGGGRLYVAAHSGLFRVNVDSRAREQLTIDVSCVDDIAANATQLVVIDHCAHALRRLKLIATQFETIAQPIDATILGVSAATAYFASTDGIRWAALEGGTSGLLTRDLTSHDDVRHIQADAHAVVATASAVGAVAEPWRIVRIDLERWPAEIWAQPSGSERMAVADGFIYFGMDTDKGPANIVRAPTSGPGTVETWVPGVTMQDIAAYGGRVYTTGQGPVVTGAR